MFKHLLLPTDGSEASERAIRTALAFARDAGARVTGIHVIQSFHAIAYKIDMIEEQRPTYEADMQAAAQRYLGVIEQAARELGVPMESRIVTAEHAWEAIIELARSEACDLIVMASHGRRGMKAIVLGSETHKVLTHSAIPVLVLR